MARIDAGDSGWVDVVPEKPDSSADVYVTTYDCGSSLKLVQVRELIEKLAETAGFKTEPTGSGMGIIIQFPESPAVQERREALAYEFTGDVYDVAKDEMKHAIEFIVDGEKVRGELK